MSKKNYFKIASAKPLLLSKIPSGPLSEGSPHATPDDIASENRTRLKEYQTLLYANHARALLIIFQGMDTSGKDGAIKHVMSGVNPQGCSVVTFKKPTTTELDHDFLWKSNRELPARTTNGFGNFVTTTL